MPIYEFQCQECDENFEKLVRMKGVTEVNCPNCGSDKTKKKISTFAARLDSASSGLYGSSSQSSCSTGST